MQNRFKIALGNVENNVEDALCSFVDCLTTASSCMVKSCYAAKKVKKTKWFDEDCRQAKEKSNTKLKMFVRNDEDRREYLEARKSYSYLL